MRPIQYQRAADAKEAVTTGAVAGRAFVAGGTTLLDLMKLDVAQPEVLIDINRLPLAEIAEAVGANGTPGLRLGALARNSDVAHHPLVKARLPLLSDALLSGASPQLRNMATTAGNLLQRTRCPYFRDTASPCNKRTPGSGCAAIEGLNRNHAVLGGSDACIAAHPSDMCVALSALDAVVVIQGVRGERQVPVGDFHLLPGDHPSQENVLEPGDLVTSVFVPTKVPDAGRARSTYLKVRDRSEYAFALVSVAAEMVVRDGVVTSVRLSLGGVGTKPWRVPAAEKVLIGIRPNRAAFEAAGALAFQGAVPRKHNAFKIELGKRSVARALSTVAGAA